MWDILGMEDLGRRFVSVRFAADYLRVHDLTVRNMVKDGRLAVSGCLADRTLRVDWRSVLDMEEKLAKGD